MRIRLLFPLTLLAAAAVHGQTHAVIAGVVADSSGAVVPSASIEVFGPARRTATTGDQGQFRIEGLPPGAYRLTVVHDGFATREMRVDAAVDASLDLKIDLTVAAVGGFVETTDKIPELQLYQPFLVTAVKARELRDTNAASFDEVLRTVAGLQHATQGNVFTRVSTRGLRDTADVLVLLDGIPFRQLNGSADLTMLPVTALQGAEFVKGAASSVYGRSAIGGVMQFYTLPDNTPRPSAELAFTTASFGTYEGQGAVNLPYRAGRVAAAGVVSRSEGYQDRTGRDTQFITLAGDHSFSRRLNLRLAYLGSDVNGGRGSIVPLRNGQPLYGITARDNFGIAGARLEGLLNSFTGKVDSEINSKLVVSNVFNFNRYSRFSTGGITILPAPTASSKAWSESDTRQDTFIDDALLRWDAGTANVRSTLLAGATFEWGNQDQAAPTFTNAPTYLGPNFNTPVTNVNNDPRGIRGAIVTSYFGQFIASLYMQDHLAVGRFGLTLGLRWDRFNQRLDRSDTRVVSQYIGDKVSPRVGADFALLRGERVNLVAFGNFAQGFRPQFPALSTLNNVIVPQLLRPETTRNLEGGLRVQAGILSAQASVFNMRKIDGQRSFRSGPEDFIFVNATTRVRGLESELRARLPKGHSAFFNYAYHNARNLEFRPTLTTNFDGYRLRMSPHDIAGGGVTLVWTRFTWTTSLAYVGSRPLRDNIVNPQVLPSYNVLTSTLAVRVGPMQIVLSGANLADHYYIADDFSSQDAGCPGQPRRVAVQVRYRF